jgi:DNA-binding MarR family transcriptional regulator
MERPMVPKKSVSPMEAHLGYWLRYVSNHVSHAFSRKVSERGVTVAEWVVLRQLFESVACAPSELAQRLGITRGAISKLVDRLESKALIARTADKSDRRRQALALTPKGRALVPALATLADDNDTEFFGHLDADERNHLIAAMKDIVRRRNLKTIPTE